VRGQAGADGRTPADGTSDEEHDEDDARGACRARLRVPERSPYPRRHRSLPEHRPTRGWSVPAHSIIPELFGYSASTKNVAGPGAWEDATRRLTDFLELRIPEMDEQASTCRCCS
jgi:hypothetical protein